MDRIEQEENTRLFQVYTVILWYCKLSYLIALRVKCIQFPRIRVLTTRSSSLLHRHTEIRFSTPKKADPKSLLSVWDFSPSRPFLPESMCICMCLHAWPGPTSSLNIGEVCECVCERARDAWTRLSSAVRDRHSLSVSLTHIPPPYIPCGLMRDAVNYVFSESTKYKLHFHAQLLYNWAAVIHQAIGFICLSIHKIYIYILYMRRLRLTCNSSLNG